MYSSAKESLNRMRRLLDAQETLDKLAQEHSSRGENTTSKTRSLSRDSKVSPRMHRLNDPNRFKVSYDGNPFDLDLDIDLPKKDHGLITSSKPKIKKALNLNSSHDGSSGEIEPRTAQDFHKKPPMKPGSKQAATTLRDITKELNNEDRKRTQSTITQSPNFCNGNLDSSPMHSQTHSVFQKPLPINCNPQQQTMSSISPRISPYNKGNTSTKTHLLTKTLSSEPDVTPAKEMFNQFLNKGHHRSLNTYENNTTEEDRLDREYRVKEPVTFKDSNKKQSKTDPFRNTMSQNQAQTERLHTPSSNNKTTTNAKTLLNNLDGSLKRRLEFDEDRVESISSRVSDFLEKKVPKTSSASANKYKLDMNNIFNNTNHMPQPKPFFKTENPPIATGTNLTAYLSTEASIGGKSAYTSTQRYESNTVRTITSLHALTSMRSQDEDRLVPDLNDKNKVLQYILDLKNKIQARELEILELKNNKSKWELEQQNQLIQIKELISENKRNEGNIEKLRHQVECQENEIEFLKKCKQRLESNLHDAGNIFDLKDQGKIKRLEATIEEKNKEIREITEKFASSKTQFDEEKAKLTKELEKLRSELNSKDAENASMKAELEALNNKMKEYKDIENKILELDEMQNALIEENNTLKNKLSLLTKPEDPSNVLPRDMAGQLLSASRKLKEIDDYAKKLVKIMQSVLKGDEPPIELILKHNRGLKDKDKLSTESEFRGLTIKQLTQQNLGVIDGLHRSFVQCMDEICDSYALKYGNECNVQ